MQTRANGNMYKHNRSRRSYGERIEGMLIEIEIRDKNNTPSPSRIRTRTHRRPHAWNH